MKILPVSLSFKGKTFGNNSENYPYLYTRDNKNNDEKLFSNKAFMITTGLFALVAVIVTFVKMRGKKK